MKKIYSSFIIALCLLFTTAAHAQTTITCDSVLQTSTCAGGNVIVPFSVTGTFPFGNVFTAQFSDWLGSFAAPVNIGTTMFTIGGNGIIFATIPANANFSLFYRIRIVSSNPQDTSNASPNTVIVTQIAQLNTIISNPGDSACPGDTITLYAVNPANAYSWSTGDTTQSIQVTASGIYSVTTTDALTCQSTTSDTVVFDPALCTGVNEHDLAAALQVYPDPADDQLTIRFNASYPDDAMISISDGIGRNVQEMKMHISGDGTQVIDVSALPSGIYFLKLQIGNDAVVKKIVVQ